MQAVPQRRGVALIVVDVQNDFMLPSGALSVKGAEEVRSYACHYSSFPTSEWRRGQQCNVVSRPLCLIYETTAANRKISFY